jgi:hypothetical protein
MATIKETKQNFKNSNKKHWRGYTVTVGENIN